MKFVHAAVSGFGCFTPFCLPASMLFSRHAMFLTRLRMVSPSSSCFNYSGVLPRAIFQYLEEMTGMQAQVKYLLRTSKDAVVPALRAVTIAEPGLNRSVLRPHRTICPKLPETVPWDERRIQANQR